MLEHVRIASLMPEQMIGGIYRSVIPMQALAQRGHTVHIEERNLLANPEGLFSFDVVQLLHFAHEPIRRLVRRLQAAGVAVIWDNDDFSLAGNMHRAGRSGVMGQAIVSGNSSMARLANVVTTPSERLAEVFRAAGGDDVRIIENHLPPTFTRPRRVMPHTGVRIGYAGAPQHMDDIKALRIRQTLESLLARYAHLEIMSIGLDFGIRSRRYAHDRGRHYATLPEYLAQLDIAIAPLADNANNHGRSNVKLKEYSAAGVPWLASPVGPYAELGEEHGGRLVADDRWYEELDALIEDGDMRSRLARRGRQWAQEETIEEHVDLWEEALADAAERASAARAVR